MDNPTSEMINNMRLVDLGKPAPSEASSFCDALETSKNNFWLNASLFILSFHAGLIVTFIKTPAVLSGIEFTALYLITKTGSFS